ncbi:trypsin-like serine protease with C-terminal PDZ domain [Terriglobus roseus DSM 18391]|uniref:Trypsin-like serine protease with C-terminal PDZ domain n=1 Tax=Terriglobus roseus (strain DSM 18391 / NRRL B-41598 / KBS 63) TaxID=926566 RepID=I3ZEP2_TERRK|nr:trypsin-like peptidase domain-containing protein [Terriglobus roseus]AFL87710.1 trypsin-like serine protease with C-terminal PDZ domain [Terriglobus roseus DSM 18391]
MPLTTNSLVTARTNARRFALPGSLAAVAVLGSAMFLHGTGVHANAISASALDDQSVSSLAALDHDMETLAARVTPAVVNVAVTSRGSDDDEDGQTAQRGIDPSDLPPQLRQFFGGGGGLGRGAMPQQQQLRHGVGSGVIISPDGYIVTNNHVVQGATQIKVTLHDRRVLTGKVIGTDKLTDIAVVKVDAHDLPAISWGDSSKLQPGQTVLAFGSPFGVLQFSVTRGIVSAVNRAAPFSSDARTPGGLIQTDAAVNPGNSGGPLVNAHGELVGINQMIATNSGSFAGASFAIPAATAKAIADQIIKTGSVHHGYLGIAMNDVTPQNAQFFNLDQALGAIVSQVTPGSPASNAGLKNGDVITSVNGKPIENGGALQVQVAQLTPGTKIDLGVLRNGSRQNINVALGEYKKDGEVAANDGDNGGQSNGGKLGLAMSDLTPEVRQQMNIPASVNGAAIAQVRPGSPAEDAGLQPGDVIMEVNRKPVASADQLASNIKTVPNGKEMLLLVWSNGGASYRVVTPNQG